MGQKVRVHRIVSMGSNRQGILVISAICLGLAATVIVEQDPFVRLVPADVLRDFPGQCFSWTAGKFFNANDTWSLKPFCGRARCVALRNTKTNATFFGEEVTDCGPLIDTEKTPECQRLEENYDKDGEYPSCCPVYDCPEGVEIMYQNKAGSKKAPKKLGEK